MYSARLVISRQDRVRLFISVFILGIFLALVRAVWTKTLADAGYGTDYQPATTIGE